MTDRDAVAEAIGLILGIALVAIAGIFLGAGALMLFWNCAIPDLTGMPPITYRNAIGLIGLIAIGRVVTQSSVSISKK